MTDREHERREASDVPGYGRVDGIDSRVPYMLIAGDTDEEADTVSVRDREERE
jgi:hypothetical protein